MSAFPAFERAQAGLSSRNLAATASGGSSSARPLSSFDPGPSGGSMSTPVPVLALDGNADALPPTPEAKVPRISKRTNARLQLAAALIEADNEELEARAQAAAAAVAGQRHDPNSPRPAPPPQPKLASQSAIFAPYREEAGSLPPPVARPRAGSSASRLSRPSLALGDEPRGSIDFLGVRLPTEKKYGYSQGAPSSTGYSHSRAGSIAGTTRLSRSGSLMSATGPLRPGDAVWDGPGERPRSSMSHGRRDSLGALAADAATDDALSDAGSDEALSDWGVEKFLSTDARSRMTGRRSRANSSLGHGAAGARPRSVLSTTSDAPRATSDIGTSATPSGQPGSGAGANAELLARIKLYRERQENLPPSQWEGPGPAADSSAVAAHLSTPQGKAAADRPTASMQQATPPHRRASSASTPGALFSTPSPRMTLNEGLGGLGLDDQATAAATKKEEGVRQGLVAHERSATVDAAPEHATIMQRRESSMGILGDSWSDQGSDDEAAPETDEEIVERLAKAAGVRVSPPSSPGPSSAAPAPRPLASASSQPAAVPRSLSVTAAQALHDGSENGHDFQPEPQDQDMAGVGSFSRSHSRRNSLMASAFLSTDERPAGAMSPVLGPNQVLNPGDVVSGGSYSRPGTPGGIGSPARRMSGFATPILGVGSVLAEDPFHHLPQGPSPYPASPANRLMELGADPYAAAAQMRHRHTDSMAGVGAGMMSPSMSFASPTSGLGQATAPQRKSLPMDSLSTKQLQALARDGAFPEYYGIIDASGPPSPAMAAIDEAELLDAAGLDPLAAAQPEVDPAAGEEARPAEQPAPEGSMPKTSRFSAIFGAGASLADAAEALRDAGEPDLSSVRWGWRKRGAQAMQDGGNGENETGQEKRTKGRGLLPTKLPFKSSAAANESTDPIGAPGSELFAKLQKAAQEQDDVDDSVTSPPTKGPLRPRGLSERLPRTLAMPAPLQGSRLAPRMRLTPPADQVLRENVAAANAKRQSQLHVPEGFVLHSGRGMPAMRQLQVGGAAGPRPLFMAPQGDKKHDAAVSAFLNSAEGRRLISIPAAAPAGIGRRAAVPTTALFRNQLVQHDEEREGWGWEATASQAPEDDGAAAAEAKKKSKGAAKRAEKKAAKLKRKRKAARAERRRKREAAKQNGTSYEAVAADESPDEDLDLSSDSSSGEASETDSDDASDASWNTEDEKRWIDNQKPAGKLFGKSLLDVAAEKKHINTSKSRYYGQTEVEEMNQAEAQSAMLGDGQSIAPSAAARSFRDNPLGYNDTRERMQAAFGTDHIWAREMAKRREEEAREAEEREVRRLAEEEFQKAEAERKLRKMRGKKGKQARAAAAAAAAAKAAEEANKTPRVDALELPEAAADGEASPPRSRTPIQAPQIALDLPTDDAAADGASSRRGGRHSETAAEWFARSEDEDSSDGSSSEDEAERRRQALQRARQSLALNPASVPVLSIDSARDGDSDSSEDNVPLSQLRKKAPPSLATGLMVGGREQSSDEELPLAAIVAKRKARESKMGTLDLDFGGSPRIPSTPAPAPEPQSDSSDDAPLGLRHANGAAALAAIAAQKAARREASGADAESDDDSDDAPLGAIHPQAAIIAEQRAVIERLQAENAQAKAAQMMGGMPSFGPYGQPAGFDPRMSFMPAMGDPRMSMMNLGMPMGGGMPAATASAANLMSYDSAAPHASPMMHHGAAAGMPAMVASPSMTPLSPPMADPKSSSIDRWRSEVAPRAPGSSGPTSKEGSDALV